jgi:hypothetical protein
MKIDTSGSRMSASMLVNSIGLKIQSLTMDNRGLEESRRCELSHILKYRHHLIV